jgi:hypothetical protein
MSPRRQQLKATWLLRLSNAFFYRIFITGHRVEPDLAEKLVDFVLVRQIPKKARPRPNVATHPSNRA